MPEGDTIYRSARALGRALTGKRITGFMTEYAQIARANDEAPFVGQTIELIEARGKWLLMHCSGSEEAGEIILATHMLMSGSWHIYRPGERWQEPRANMRIVIETADFVAVAFRVPVARIYTEAQLAREWAIPKAASDVLKADFDPVDAVRRMRSFGSEEIAHVMLRQTVLAGVGNVFKSEICFLEGISPFAKVATLSDAQLQSLVALARKLLAANVLEDSGDQIVTFQGRKRRTTNNSNPGESLWVYGRKNEPCRKCGTAIQRCLQGPNARSTYWCSVCQPLLPDH
jgi:endonuclease-8